MTRYRYEIDTENAIRVWDDENPNETGAPFMFQPDWPDRTPWESAAQATEWVEIYIASLVNPESEFLAGDSPEQPKMIRPIVAELDPAKEI